jgi:hypothetical protein
MTIATLGTVTVTASPRDVLEFVCDLDRYREADTKIVKVIEQAVLAEDGTGRTKYKGRLRGISSPADSNDVHLTRWSRADFIGSPDSFVRHLVDFHGWFTCEPTTEGTLVTHGETFTFHRPGKWLMEPYLRQWLQDDIATEMLRLHSILNQA